MGLEFYDQCKDKDGNSNKIGKLNSGENSFPGASLQANPQDAVLIQRCVSALEHSCECPGDENCSRVSCTKMKRVLEHSKACRRKIFGLCHICKQLIVVCYVHALKCHMETDCAIPFCIDIKNYFRQKNKNRRC